MTAKYTPAQEDAAAAEKKSKKELMKERLEKACEGYMKKGFSKEEALKMAKKALHKEDLAKAVKEHVEKGMDPAEAVEKAMAEVPGDDDDEDGDEKPELEKGVEFEGIKKALEDVAGILSNPQMNQAIITKDKMDDLVKSLDGSAKSQFEAVQGELYHTRKVLREYVDSTRALGKAVQAMGEELVKALTDLQFASADSVKKSLAVETVPEHLSSPKVAEAPRASETTVVPTPAESAGKAPVSAEDFISKANAWIESNPRDPMVKSLGTAIGELCSPGGDLKAQVDQFGKLIGLV